MKSGFSAGELAIKISSAPPEDLVPLYRQAMLSPTVFKKLFDTFHGDLVSKAKLKQRASDLKVHPDETTACVDLYVAGMTVAELVKIEGDMVKHLASNNVADSIPGQVDEAGNATTDGGLGSEKATDDEENGKAVVGVASDSERSRETLDKTVSSDLGLPSGPRAVFNVNVTLDSSMDIEKLQKQLELLKRFGAI